MKYTASIEIALPRNDVVKLLVDPTHLPQWLRGMVSHEPIDGEHGQHGTRSHIVLQMGQQTIEATEIVTRREPENLDQHPTANVVYYERELIAQGMWSAARERLIEIGPEITLWESENEYRFSNVLMRMLAPFMRGAFRKQSERHMLDFKAFAEQGTDVREARNWTPT